MAVAADVNLGSSGEIPVGERVPFEVALAYKLFRIVQAKRRLEYLESCYQ